MSLPNTNRPIAGSDLVGFCATVFSADNIYAMAVCSRDQGTQQLAVPESHPPFVAGSLFGRADDSTQLASRLNRVQQVEMRSEEEQLLQQGRFIRTQVCACF